MKAPRYTRKDAVCPRCGCHERHRALIRHLDLNERLEGMRVLDIAPVQGYRSYFEKRGAMYVSTDLFIPSMVKGNMLNAPFRDKAFDIIICYHVLEHIRDDITALSEIGRICKQDGRAYIQVPIDQESTRTVEYDAPDPYCHDHVRQYGMDFQERIKASGLRILSSGDYGDIPDKRIAKRLGISMYAGITYLCSPL